MKKQGFHKLFVRLLAYKPWMFIISVLLNVVIFSYGAAVAYFVREILNYVAKDTSHSGSVMPHVMIFFLGFFVVSLIRMGAITACAVMDNVQRFHYEGLLRNNIMKSIYKKDNIKNIVGKSGKVFEILDHDVFVCTFPSELLSEVSGFVIYSFIAIASLLIINWRVTIYIFIPLSLAILIINTTSKKINQNRKANREIHTKVSETISDAVNLVQTIKISDSQDSILKHYEKLNKARLKVVLKDTLFGSGLQAILGSTVYVGTAVIMLVVAKKMMQGEFQIGDFSMFIAYLGTLASCVERIVELISYSKQAQVSYDRILEVVGEKNENQLTVGCKLSAFKKLEKFQSETMERTPLKEIAVRNLTYAHDDRSGIYDVNFTLKPGEILAVAGGVGSGKSTLLNVLMGIIPKDSGDVLWNGTEIKDTKEFFVPPNAAYTPQVTKMFSDTIGENLLLGKANCEAVTKEALHSAVFENDVSEMEKGLDTQVGSEGSKLSGGQRQRLSLARMFIHNAELYIMDDSSSAIDTKTENEFWSRFYKNISKNKFACIIASNKRNVLQSADKIIFMKNGHVVDCGKADELSKRCKDFASIYAG